MQKKLYFLNEEEKNRILSLHESRTKSQYLLSEAIDRKTFTKKVDDICTTGTYGKGNLTDEKIKKDAEVMVRNFTGTRKSNESLKVIADNIRKLNSIGNYCKVAKKYKELGGRGSSLTDWMRTFVFMDNAWELYIKQPLEELIKNSEALKEKSNQDYTQGVDGTQAKDNSNKDYAAYADAAIAKSKVGGGTNQVAGGTILPQVVTPDVVKQLRTMGGLTDTAATLTQKDINDLYALFFHNLPKK
jgi:hypothetical protein